MTPEEVFRLAVNAFTREPDKPMVFKAYQDENNAPKLQGTVVWIPPDINAAAYLKSRGL